MKPRAERTQMVAFGQQIGPWGKSPPKNSLALIHKAVAKYFDVIELDIRVSIDGIPVLSHDDLLKGPEGEIIISKSTSIKLQNFLIGNYDGVPQFALTLSEALSHTAEKKVLIDPPRQACRVFCDSKLC